MLRESPNRSHSFDLLWQLREERFNWRTAYLKQHKDPCILPTLLPESETT